MIPIPDAAGRTGRPGFTVVETLIVLTLIGLLTALIGPRILGRMSEARGGQAAAHSSWK
ncbi:MAG: type II secretion system GspH family protein [Actinobacteria bacterium]|nr:type II secretion system GspH family protein [Actinomycetota bacterium]